MVERDEDFLSGEENEEEIFPVRRETDARVKSVLKSGLVHRHTVYQAAVTLRGNLGSGFIFSFIKFISSERIPGFARVN